MRSSLPCLFLIAFVIALMGGVSPAHAKHKSHQAEELPVSGAVIDNYQDTPQGKNDLKRIDIYLNGLRNISADFLQVDELGNMMNGSIAIQRPGKMRVTYTAPNKDFIVADGSWVHIWNSDLQSQTNIEQSSSLAEFILRDPIKLEGDVTIKDFKKFPHKLELTLVETGDPGTGSLTLVFEDNPLILRQWKVLDAQGHLTGVSLENERSEVSFPASTFLFVPPNFGKGGKAE